MKIIKERFISINNQFNQKILNNTIIFYKEAIEYEDIPVLYKIIGIDDDPDNKGKYIISSLDDNIDYSDDKEDLVILSEYIKDKIEKGEYGQDGLIGEFKTEEDGGPADLSIFYKNKKNIIKYNGEEKELDNINTIDVYILNSFNNSDRNRKQKQKLDINYKKLKEMFNKKIKNKLLKKIKEANGDDFEIIYQPNNHIFFILKQESDLFFVNEIQINNSALYNNDNDIEEKIEDILNGIIKVYSQFDERIKEEFVEHINNLD